MRLLHPWFVSLFVAAAAVASRLIAPAAAVAQPEGPMLPPGQVAARVVATLAELPEPFRQPLAAAVAREATPRVVAGRPLRSGLVCPTTTTSARLVDLNGDDVPEVLLEARGPCAGEPDGTSWLFARQTATGRWDAVAEEDGGFAPLRSRSRGYVDLISAPGTAQVIRRWDGTAYRELCMVSNSTGNTCPRGLPGPDAGNDLPAFSSARVAAARGRVAERAPSGAPAAPSAEGPAEISPAAYVPEPPAPLANAASCAAATRAVDEARADAAPAVRARYAAEYLRLLEARDALSQSRAEFRAQMYEAAFGALYYHVVDRALAAGDPGRGVPWNFVALNRAYDAWADNRARYRTGGAAAVERHWGDYFRAVDRLRAERTAGSPAQRREGWLDYLIAVGARAYFDGDLARAVRTVRAQAPQSDAAELRANASGFASVLASAQTAWGRDWQEHTAPAWGAAGVGALTWPRADWARSGRENGEARWARTWASPLAVPGLQPVERRRRACPDGPGAGPVTRMHSVQIIYDRRRARFDPQMLTVVEGEAVTFTNVEGGPHNVAFWPDGIPGGSRERLAANISDPLAATARSAPDSDIQSPFTMNVNDGVTVSFAGVPLGTYRFRCVAHQALDEVGVITVVARPRTVATARVSAASTAAPATASTTVPSNTAQGTAGSGIDSASGGALAARSASGRAPSTPRPAASGSGAGSAGTRDANGEEDPRLLEDGTLAVDPPGLSPRHYPDSIARGGIAFTERERYNLGARGFARYYSRDRYLGLALEPSDAFPNGVWAYVEAFPLDAAGNGPDINTDGGTGRAMAPSGAFRFAGRKTFDAGTNHPYGTMWIVWAPPRQGRRPELLPAVRLYVEYNRRARPR